MIGFDLTKYLFCAFQIKLHNFALAQRHTLTGIVGNTMCRVKIHGNLNAGTKGLTLDTVIQCTVSINPAKDGSRLFDLVVPLKKLLEQYQTIIRIKCTVNFTRPFQYVWAKVQNY